ncbi:hypothetical protein Q7P35_009953 [Cladosporium inversicolor]
MYGGIDIRDVANKCCRHDEISSVPVPRHGDKRQGKSKEGAKVQFMGANVLRYLQAAMIRGGGERARGRLDMLSRWFRKKGGKEGAERGEHASTDPPHGTGAQQSLPFTPSRPPYAVRKGPATYTATRPTTDIAVTSVRAHLERNIAAVHCALIALYSSSTPGGEALLPSLPLAALPQAHPSSCIHHLSHTHKTHSSLTIAPQTPSQPPTLARTSITITAIPYCHFTGRAVPSFRISSCDNHLASIMTLKVRFAIDEMAGAAAAAAAAKGKGERASKTMVKVERKGMWESTKHDSTLTAQKSLQQVARRANAQVLNEHAAAAGVQAWAVAIYGKLPSARGVVALIADSGVRPVKQWLRGFTEAGRAERIEQDWEDAVKRAHATHALHEHMEDLKASRARYDQATDSAVSSALGHRHSVEPERTVQTPPLPSAGPAGSIFSKERVAFPSPVERPAAEIITPGMRQLKPTQPRSVDTVELEGPDPEEIYQPHSIFRDPAYVDIAKLRNWKDIIPKDADCVDRRYYPALDQNDTFGHFNEVITSYSESLEEYPPMGKSERCLDLVDQLMKGDDGYMVLFGRWRHRKDAPLSLVKNMIEQELRGPGACSLYGPGGLKTSEHPLVCHYDERLSKLQEEQTDNSVEPNTPELLSPVLLQGSSASQRFSLRSNTPITFSMSGDGTFRTTGFQTWTGSTGSTVESISPKESSERATDNAQKDTRRDSGVHGMQPDAYPNKVPDMTGHTSLGNYEVLRYYTPDPALNYKALNDQTAPEYSREQPAMVTSNYITKFCGGYNRNIQPSARARVPQQQRPHTQDTEISGHQCTPQFQAPQAPSTRNATREHEVKLGYEPQRFHSRRLGQQEPRDHNARHQHEAPPTRHVQHPQCPVPAQRYQPPETKQQKHACLDTSLNVTHFLPTEQECEVTQVALEDAENAVFSDDKSATVDTKQVPNNNATKSSQPRSPCSASIGAHGTYPRSILKRSSNDAAASISSSVSSATAKETAGLNTSTEPTPLHATPGTTASSGREYQIQSPPRARSIARKLDERLKQIETQSFHKNAISL